MRSEHPHPRDESEDRPGEDGDRCARRDVHLHGQPEAEHAFAGDERGGAELPGLEPPRQQPDRRSGNDEERRHEQRPDRRQRRDHAKRNQDEQDRVRRRRADPERPCAARIEADREPASPEEGARGQHDRAGEGCEDEIAPADQQQAAEQERVDARARIEDVAGENHPECESTDEHERGEAVVPASAATREPLDPERECEGGGERAKRRREAEAVREHEPGEGRRPDGVREECEPAQDDPRAEQPCPKREQHDLDQATLDECVLERREHTLSR